MSTVFIVDDDATLRESLSWLLEAIGFKVQAYANCAAFLSHYRSAPPECLILELRLPQMSGLELQAELRRRSVSLPIIFLSKHVDVPSIVQTIKAGAIDFLVKPCDPPDLIKKVTAAITLNQESHAVAEQARAARARLAALTPREREVMELTMRGQLCKEIAEALGLSPRTVEQHRARILQKSQTANFLEFSRLLETARKLP